ncbi:L-idonate 5-dehydrogenase [Saccharopolyspora kobensis]|uniref:L-idonate 5-dehydrogenase n=1 Tax=Saccharopolyspora kobensis TaxID=146035 RepID=A0A1H5ZMX4_9PSEU|nr:L-idonate 5-dehydrogenase [Saccharopolyspora kobensis]SEG37913.1 L-idonate 5-dehydrogenase [Saccharopolyspora kobensis]SFF21963.1 L-idonate 5-dehydrogenase [Saccharopolyspora kobensis]
MSTRACVVHGAGDLRVEEREAAPPGGGEVAVSVALGGICGSDLHYYHRGSVGDFQVREPMVLGHEVVGHVAATGDGVNDLAVGAPVAIHPATPCGSCPECALDHRNVCAHSRYLGSAARTPHVQGGFAQHIVVPADQVRPLPDGLGLRRAVLAEPLSVALHAVRRAGDVAGRRVLVTGAGPIGCLAVAALRDAGAAEVIVTDLLDAPLAIAAQVGATSTIRADRGMPDQVDLAIEASGSAAGLSTCVQAVRRRGTVVLLGLLPPGETGFLGNVVVTRELQLTGAFRFDHEFDEALSLLAGGLPVDPVLTHTFPLSEATAAFDIAGNRAVASKVLLDLTAPVGCAGASAG